MKRYEEIFVPDIENGDYWAQNEQDESKSGYWLTPKENVIVLTEEELREVFSVGYDFAKNVPGNKDFQELMQSKGIKL
jgi:hypothetical protein